MPPRGPRRIAVPALALALLLVGCTGEGADQAEQAAVVSLGDPTSQEWTLDELDLSSEHRSQLLALLERNAGEVPDLPEPLLQADKRPAVVHELEADPGGDGVLAGRLTVANPHVAGFRAGVVCIRDWAQVPCGPAAATIQTDLPAWSATQSPFAVDEAVGATVFALLLLEDDRRGIDSTSMAHLIHEPSGWDEETSPPASSEPYEAASPFPGCGFAVFHDGRSVAEGYALPDVVDASGEVSVLLLACEDYEPLWMVPLLIRNRSEVVDADWVGDPVLFDRTIALPVPGSVLSDPSTNSLQFVWFLRDEGGFLSAHTPEVVVE